MKHTKRKWELSKFTGKIVVKENNHTRIICTLEVGKQAQFGPVKMPPQAEADAHLIVAAPDLLEACKAITADLDNCPGDFNYNPVSEDNLRTAIKKAEGVE